MGASLGMGQQSYELTTEKVAEVVTKTSAGNYALGYLESDGGFVPEYVGRADEDVKDRLSQHARQKKYQRFKFSYASSPKAAFEKECQNWHDWKGQLDNKIHPDRPAGTNWKCPVAGCTDLS